MIGGVVIETIALPDRIWINCEEEISNSRCAIYVKRTTKSEQVTSADSIWWQGAWAMWTPFASPRTKCGSDCDIKLERLGFSGVTRPEAQWRRDVIRRRKKKEKK
jgi:hypothetical protein